MIHTRLLTGGLIALCLAACATPVTARTAEQEMMEADRAFAARALDVGPAQAFIDFAADDVTIFPAGGAAARGKAALEAWTGKWPEGSMIEWAPEAAHASKGGDFGYTWGYAKFTQAGEESVSWGKYVTIWQRQADGSWKWIADTGSAAPPPGER